MIPMRPYAPPQSPWFEVLYEDEAIIVLNKQAGLLSVPGKYEPDCLEARVQMEYPDALTVHRLDMATSGVCVMARSKEFLAYIGMQFEKRETSKRYVAIVRGRPEQTKGTVDAPMRCDWPNRPLQMICHEQGRPAVTHWSVIGEEGGNTRLALTPVTGRSHQLRVHLQSIGHPILGDEWYAHEDARNAAPRLLLHAEELSFAHPVRREWVTFIAPCPF